MVGGQPRNTTVSEALDLFSLEHEISEKGTKGLRGYKHDVAQFLPPRQGHFY